MARIVNQNNEVIGTKKTSGNNKNGNKTTVSKTSFIVGVALALAALAIIIVVILFVTKKNNENKESKSTPLLEYIDNYKGRVKTNQKIQVLSGLEVAYELEKFSGECYILIYDTNWTTSNDMESDVFKSYDRLDSYLTGRPRIDDGKTPTGDSMLKAIEDCGKDIKFFVVDMASIKKQDSELETNPEYFKMKNGTSFQSLQAPMFFHYIETETYDSMGDKDLLIADGNTRVSEWGSIIVHEVNYLNKLTNNNDK